MYKKPEKSSSAFKVLKFLNCLDVELVTSWLKSEGQNPEAA